MEIKLDYKYTPLNLDSTLNCGQVFRWIKKDKSWYGIIYGNIIQLRQENTRLLVNSFPDEFDTLSIQRYLRLDDNLPEIYSRIEVDVMIQQAINTLHGLRLVRQDPWECMISFICSSFSNISRIKSMIFNLSRKYGEEIVYNGLTFYTFPSSATLAKAELHGLLECKLGFRARYVKEASQMIEEQDINLESYRRIPYREAKQRLLTIPGIGPKVADCILLFSLDKLEAFPVDVWIKRVLTTYYNQLLPRGVSSKQKTLTTTCYEYINTFARAYFGKYAGYAQEYLFHYYRFHDIKPV